MSSEEFYYWLRGIPRSLTMWFSAIVFAVPIWWPEVHGLLTKWLGDDASATRTITTLMGITIILLRFHTTESIPQKGGKQDVPPSA